MTDYDRYPHGQRIPEWMPARARYESTYDDGKPRTVGRLMDNDCDDDDQTLRGPAEPGGG